MSAGRASEGAGCVTWWGFSPARDLLSTGPVKYEGDANILIVGSGDPRHILKTIAGLQEKQSVYIWVIENSMEVVARQLLLLYLALIPQKNMGLNEKTEVFLEVFGNSEIRSKTGETIRLAASQLSLSVTESLEEASHACLNTTLLKFRERDELDRIFKLWTRNLTPSSLSPISMSKAWDYRLRQHLGMRYDSKHGCFDWDLTMKMHEKGGRLIEKQQYHQWRERGLAFEMREGVYQTTNPSLLSSREFIQRGNKVSVRGYWGDIVSSPYLSFGIESDDKGLLKTQNGIHTKTAQDVSFANVQRLFQSLSSRRGCPTTTLPHTDSETTLVDTKSVPIKDLMDLRGISVIFLPLDSLQKLHEKQKYSRSFNTIYFSASCAHRLEPTLRQIAAPDAVLVVELAKYILDLNKEQEEGFSHKVTSMALEAGFEPWNEGTGGDAHVVFTQQTKGK
ncbi:dynein assembly factor 3, axonemal isoform X2 [Gouania willdenowi]|uniref:Dynein axonemal assembly factor 3 n=2 Tax=Gouania willdenowi TaxID=441366 RepID=A0A8C5GRJ7_GOUWI|nr:dynein assembly factor 3, axonemal isoform X2 [Gouania willdenowi]